MGLKFEMQQKNTHSRYKLSMSRLLTNVIMKKTVIILLCYFSVHTVAFAAQEIGRVIENDTARNYYIGHSELLSIKAYLLLKINSIDIFHENERIRLVPNSPVAIGLGFNFKGLSLALGIGLPQSSKNKDKYGSTNRFDIQMSIYSRRVGGDAYFQLYKGYYNANPEDFIQWEKDYFPKIPAMQTISVGANVYYIFNHNKYSNKAAYARTQLQLKSAGSFTLGYFVNFDEVDSPEGFIPQEYPDSVANDFDIKSFRYFATGITIGYMYTWVISKRFFVSGSFIPGFGYKDIKLTDGAGESGIERHPHAQLLLRVAVGYEYKRFYAGLTGLSLIRNIKYKDYNIDLATEQLRFTIGLRF